MVVANVFAKKTVLEILKKVRTQGMCHGVVVGLMLQDICIAIFR